ncbi:MAG: EAL domain-containing protein [Pseudomonadales bacterium]
MNDLNTPDLTSPVTAATSRITSAIDDALETDIDSSYIACAVVEVLRAAELSLQVGESSFELLLEDFLTRLQEFAQDASLVVRLPGHRFCIVLPALSGHEHLKLAAEKLKRTLSPPITIVNNAVMVQCNVGLAILPLSGADASRLFAAAESALQRCSAAERYVVYDPDSVSRETNSWTLRVELETALQRNEFLPYFEPVANLSFGTIVAARATLAWNSAKLGVVPFTRLMADMVATSMLRPIYWHMLKGVMLQVAKWPATVSLVLPVPDALLDDDEVLYQIRDALELYGLEPSRLTLEINEQALALSGCIALLGSLREHGCRIRIANLGTGGFPLAQLTALKVDEIKFARAMFAKSLAPAIRNALIKLFIAAGSKLVVDQLKDAPLLARFRDAGFTLGEGPAVGPIQGYGPFANWITRKVGA